MVSIAMRQIILIGVICFGTIGMFNAMSSIGNAGKHSPTSQNLAITSSSIAYIIGFLIAGGTHNMLGPRPCVAFGGLTFVLYAGSMLLAKDNEHSPYPPLAGILLGLGAGCIWVTQGAMMMSYPTEDNKGKYIACFWAIFNLGAVLGSVLPLVLNYAPDMDKNDVSESTYKVYMVIMGLATFLAFFLSRPSSIVRDNGEPIVVAKFAGIKAECIAILSVFCDWRMLLLIPAFFFSNFSYTYQFNDFNGIHFSIRTRSLNSIIFWVAQIIGALVIGYLLDRIPWKRPRRALLGLFFIAVMFMATWIGALMMQLRQHNWDRRNQNEADLIDLGHGTLYGGLSAIYAMFGFCDAAFAVYCYWLMGALSNKHEELSRYAGFFKSIQSLGSAVAAPLDLAQTPLKAYLITNWILCAFSIAAMFLVCRTVTDTTLDEPEDYDEEEEDFEEEEEYEETDSYYDGSHVQEEDEDEEDDENREQDLEQGSGTNRHSDSQSRTLGGRDSSTLCATSERCKSACWRSSNGNLDSEDCSSDQRLANHDSFMSSNTAVSSQQSKRRSSSILSGSSIVGRTTTTCPSPTFQHAHQQVRRTAHGRLARAQSQQHQHQQPQVHVEMQEIQTEGPLSYYYHDYDQASSPSPESSQLHRQQQQQLQVLISSSSSSSQSIPGPTVPSIVFSADLPSSTVAGTSSMNPYLYSSWATSPPSPPSPQLSMEPHMTGSTMNTVGDGGAPSNEYLQPVPHFLPTTQAGSSTTSVPRSVRAASQASSTRYEEDQDMDDSIDTSLSHEMNEDTNVCIRFCLGNTDLSLAKGLEQIMEEHPVIAWTDLYIFGFYGLAEDIVEAVLKTFYIDPAEVTSTLTSPKTTLKDDGLLSKSKLEAASVVPQSTKQTPKETRDGNSQTSATTTTKTTTISTRDTGSRVKAFISRDVGMEEAKDKGVVGASASGSSDTFGGERTDGTSQTIPTAIVNTSGTSATNHTSPLNTGRVKLPPHMWKTDYDLRLQLDYASSPSPSSSSPMSKQGAFTSYLVGEESVEDCYLRRGLILEDLLEARDFAEMKVSDSLEYGMTMIETTDLESLRSVLLGILTALSKDPVREHAQKWVQDEYSEDRIRWDASLRAYRDAHEDTSTVQWVIDGWQEEGGGWQEEGDGGGDEDHDRKDGVEDESNGDYNGHGYSRGGFRANRNRDPWGEQNFSGSYTMSTNYGRDPWSENTSTSRTPMRDVDAFIGDY
ncbi:hypothetical protein BGZ83_005689 [Gryganskiella cystojenkinii]|nr:hypothetical protein BGZ83_005689 [Gryganskiella cystojenkinii]